MRVLSGIQPSGALHIGNYFGAIRQYVALQDGNDAFYFVANYHALTSLRDAEALRRTLESGRSWFYSRSRQEYWQKGETSGDRQYVREVRMDCDGDALVVLVDQHGKGACHTGERTCFFRTVGHGPGVPRTDSP